MSTESVSACLHLILSNTENHISGVLSWKGLKRRTTFAFLLWPTPFVALGLSSLYSTKPKRVAATSCGGKVPICGLFDYVVIT